jgi:hypothetical protein
MTGKTCDYCKEDLSKVEYYIECDSCGISLCEGVEHSSCWHQHLMETHKIDWTVHTNKGVKE